MRSTDDVTRYYEDGKEINRLSTPIGALEFARTQELLVRYLPAPTSIVCDIGGAHGPYSFWLASLGYGVHLVDSTPLHIEQAVRTQGEPGSSKLASMQVGDARHLSFSDSTADAVILHGPLYHLISAEDRKLALQEAYRVMKPGGLLLAFAISNYSSAIVGITRGWMWDADNMTMCEEEVTSGNRIRPDSWPSQLATAFFHHPRVLNAELEDSGFVCEEVLGIQGPAWIAPDFEESWDDPVRREVILRIARMMEDEPVLSPHMMAMARRQA